MNIKNKKLTSIPTNVVTGFLGSGKTSTILHLLKQKPVNERWAVLVNEFGEIGVDGSFIEAQTDHSPNIFVQEVSGGCMCCSSGLTMQVALNQLLNEAKPHRLLIEPTGLGHPAEVLQTLSNQYYKGVLSLEKTITLVDARNLSNKRYTEHSIFNQQLHIADIIVASKCDLYSDIDRQVLLDYVKSENIPSESIVFIKHGELELSLLAGKTSSHEQGTHHSHNLKNSKSKSTEKIPKSGFIKALNQGEGFQSIGWHFTSEKIFDRSKLLTFINSINIIRLKGVFITSAGTYGYNVTDNEVTEIKLDTCTESRIEIICDQINNSWEALLLNTLNNKL